MFEKYLTEAKKEYKFQFIAGELPKALLIKWKQLYKSLALCPMGAGKKTHTRTS